MKNKIVCLVLCGMLVGCLKAGSYDLFPVRKKIVDSVTGYSIDFVDQEEYFVTSKNEREHNYVMNKAITVKKSEPMFADKSFVRNVYASKIYKPNKKGVLQNQSFPVKLDNKKEYKVIGWVNVDGVKYSLLESDLDDYVFLFDEQGNFYKNAGWIENGVLKLLDEEIFVYPSDLKMQSIVKTRDELSNVKSGYEIRYGGADLDRIWFDYMEYDDQNSGSFEKLSFPNKPGLIMINGKGLRILKADDDALTFMILKDDM